MSFDTVKSTKTFNEIYKKGKSWHTPTFVCFYLPSEDRKIGVVASKKVGKAVDRNRAKRLLRELVRYALPENGHFVLVAKPPILDTDFEQLKDQIKRAFKQVTRPNQ